MIHTEMPRRAERTTSSQHHFWENMTKTGCDELDTTMDITQYQSMVYVRHGCHVRETDTNSLHDQSWETSV